MRYTKLRTWAILLAVVLCVIIVLNYSGGDRGMYKSPSPITDSLVTASYPDLYGAVAQRDAQLLKPFLSHQNREVRRQAWRAFASTPTDSLSAFIDLAVEQNSDVAWFGISQHTLSSGRLRALEQRWQKNPSHRAGIARVLGRQGDKQSLNFLLSKLEGDEAATGYPVGLAVGRLINRFNISGDQQIRVIQEAFDAENYETTRAYLYGWYRGDESRLTSAAQDTLYTRWRVLGAGTNAEVDQYVNKMLKERTTSDMTIFYNGEQRLEEEIQLSVELAKSIEQLDMTNENSLAAKILLTNRNPHVRIQALESLHGKLSVRGDLYNYISGSMLTDSTLAKPVWLGALHAAVLVDEMLVEKYRGRLQNIAGENVYLLPDVLAIYEEVEGVDAYLQRIADIVAAKKPRRAMYALQRLDQYWQGLAEGEKSEKRIEQVRDIVFNALELRDRGVAYMAQSLLRKKPLFTSGDFSKINRYLSTFSLPGDIEVYQAFGSLYKDRFEEQARGTIDSLASLDYTPLNRSLADAGWDVKVPEEAQPDFRLPNWKRLWELGRKPVWTMKTEKGIITIQLNTLSAPATVSMIDSLSRAGAYEGVPFHRVVPNFVIQGGDYERKDGFGGPDFVIPTEASEQEFNRGAVGIASAGTDTEGSQYFIMHQWKPHLNGGYTRFGKVAGGMDVVDKITVGDKVLSTTWY